MPPDTPSPSSIAPSEGGLPARIGGYRVLRRLATGGTSDVLLARAEGPHGFERPVVLKLLLQEYRNEQSFERMFAREAAAYARLSHPAIVKLYDFLSDGGQLVMVLEYVDGLPLHRLRAMLKRTKFLDDEAALFIGARIFGALAAAHAARDPQTGEPAPVIHRDVNPSNVLIPWDGHVKIADFGIAKVAGLEGDKTQAGFIKGTYGYMAPEQVRAEPLSVRADVYAGALVLWELLAGRKAIVRGGASDLDVLRAMATPAFPSLASVRPDLPRAVLDAVAAGLERDAKRRTISAEELGNALRGAGDLELGRQQLVQAMSAARPPARAEGADGTDVRRTPIDMPPDSSADATIPNRVLVSEAGPPRDTLVDTQEAPALRTPLPPPMPPPRLARQPTLMGIAPGPPAAIGAPRAPAPLPVAWTPPIPDVARLAAPAAWTPPPPAPPSARPSAPVPPPIFYGSKPPPAPEQTPRRGRVGLVVALAIFALGAVATVAIAWARMNAPTAYVPPAAPGSASSPRASAAALPPAPRIASPPAPSAPPPPAAAPAATTGTVTVPPSRSGHRVWVDRRIVGESPGSFTVRCGRHAVKVGSEGAARTLDVPCGGDVVAR